MATALFPALFFLSLLVFGLLLFYLPRADQRTLALNQDYHRESLGKFVATKDLDTRVILVDAVDEAVAAAVLKSGAQLGAHHAYSYKAPTGIVPGSTFAGLYNSVLARPWVVGIARTQDKTLEQQLRAGVRVMDMRFSFVDGELVVDHGVIFGTCSQFLAELRAALVAVAPEETVRILARRSDHDQSTELETHDIVPYLDEHFDIPAGVEVSSSSHGTVGYTHSSDFDVVNRLITGGDQKHVTALVVTPTVAGIVVSVALVYAAALAPIVVIGATCLAQSRR
jgi:hypothetical protein